MLWANSPVLEQNLKPFLSSILDFLLNKFFSKKRGILRNSSFDKICSRIHKNELTYKLCTILEWDKYQQFADFIKFGVFWSALILLWKTFVQFFLNKTIFENFTSQRASKLPEVRFKSSKTNLHFRLNLESQKFNFLYF